MRYNSIEHFLQVHFDGFVAVMENAQRGAGGHYALMTAAELRENSHNDVRDLMQTLQKSQLNRGSVQQAARVTDNRGIDLEDLTRMSLALDKGLAGYVQLHLEDQPDLRDELVRRIRHLTASFRSNVTAVKLDKTLRQLNRS